MADEIISTYTEGDTLPQLARTMPATTGLPNLTGATVVLRIFRTDATTLTKTITEALTADGQIDTPTATPPGFFFIFVAADLQAGSPQRAEIEYQDGSGGIATERDIFFDVAAQLG